jgi:hypothetical protein
MVSSSCFTSDTRCISLEMPVPSQGHYGFHSFPVVDWFCLFIYLWVLTFPLEDCSEFGNFVITHIYSSDTTCYKSWMKTGTANDYDKRNTSMYVCLSRCSRFVHPVVECIRYALSCNFSQVTPIFFNFKGAHFCNNKTKLYYNIRTISY